MISNRKAYQRGVSSIEFPLIVSLMMVLIIGLTVIFKVLFLQSKLDNVAFSLVSAASSSLLDKGSANYSSDSAHSLLTLAKRYLPGDIEEQIGLVLEVRLGSQPNRLGQWKAGSECAVKQSIDLLSNMAPIGDSSYPSLAGRTADLFQITLCVINPLQTHGSFFEWLDLRLPESMSSRAVMIGRVYGN